MLHRNPFGAVLRGRPVLLDGTHAALPTPWTGVAQPTMSESLSVTAFPDTTGGLFPDLATPHDLTSVHLGRAFQSAQHANLDLFRLGDPAPFRRRADR